MSKTYLLALGERLRELRHASWAWFLKSVALPLGDRLFGQRMVSRLHFLEEAQWWDRERLAAHRDVALSNLIHVAYGEVSFYRDLLDRAGLRPGDIRTAYDLHKLPIVTKEMLRSGYPDRVTRHSGYRSFEASTSGSTGTNFRIRQDSFTWGWTRASFLLALEWAGWRFGERHMQTGMTLTRRLDKRLKDFLLGCHYLPANDLSDERLDQHLELIEHLGIKHVWGYPASVHCIAQRALALGWNRPLRSVVTWGDNLYPHYRKDIEKAFQVRVCDTYGCMEGMQIAAQCGERAKYHIHALDVVLELLDDSGAPVEPGQPGNVVITRLHPGPMPYIRYRVGDIGIAGGQEPCPCGRGFPILAAIQGRDTDVVVTPSGKRLIVHFFTGILEHYGEIHRFQVVQKDVQRMLLRIVPTSSYSAATEGQITRRLKEMGALDIEIEIELVDEIPLTKGGKRRFVISELPTQQPGDAASIPEPLFPA